MSHGEMPTLNSTALHSVTNIGADLLSRRVTTTDNTGMWVDGGSSPGTSVGQQLPDHFPTLDPHIIAKVIGENQVNKRELRLVQIFIADNDESIPLDNAILHSGSQFMTDSTDEELFFDIPIKDILDDHNAYRITVLDKKASKGQAVSVNLEPIRIRDLVMTVVTIAHF